MFWFIVVFDLLLFRLFLSEFVALIVCLMFILVLLNWFCLVYSLLFWFGFIMIGLLCCLVMLVYIC